MAKEKFIIGKHDSGHHDGLASYRRKLETAELDQAIYEQLMVSMSVYRQRANLPLALVDYHTRILVEWGLLETETGA